MSAPAADSASADSPNATANATSDIGQPDIHGCEERSPRGEGHGQGAGATTLEVAQAGSSAAVYSEAPSKSAPSEATTPSGSEHGQSTPATDPVSLEASTPTVPVQAPGLVRMGDSHRRSVASLLNADDALRLCLQYCYTVHSSTTR